MTLADFVEAWARQQGRDIPPRDSAAWRELFLAWAARNRPQGDK